MPGVIGFDTETHLFENGKMAPKVVCLTVDTGEAPPEIYVGDDIEDRMQQLLEGETPLVAHNASYDTACLSATYPKLQPLIWQAYDDQKIHCSFIRERLLDIAKNEGSPRKGFYSLESVAFRRGVLLEIDKTCPWRTKYKTLENIPLVDWPDDAVDYALKDATATKLIWETQTVEAASRDYEEFGPESARQALYDFPMRLMSAWGIRTDRAAVEALQEKTKKRIDEVRETLKKHEILRYSTPSAKKLSKDTKRIQALVERELENPPKTNSGATSVAKDVLEKCNHEALLALVEWNSLIKAQSNYIDKLWEGVTGNVHATFRVLGARSGRTSCAGPNLQNQTRGGGIRDCFKARDGYVFVIADYDSQETRSLAQVLLDILGRSSLAEKYQADPDYDPHSNFAAQLMGITYEKALELKKEGDPLMLERRQQSKAANFGFPGGLGAKTFMSYARGYGVNLEESEAYNLKENWFKSIPEMRDYFRFVDGLVRAGGVLEQVRSGRIRGGCSYTAGANSFFQGLASDASKTALWFVARACYDEEESPLFGSRPVVFVHDELILECPEDKAEAAAVELQSLMLKAMALWCPDVPARATPKISKTWEEK